MIGNPSLTRGVLTFWLVMGLSIFDVRADDALPLVQPPRMVGDASTPASLKSIDELVRKFGIDGRFYREVRYVDGSFASFLRSNEPRGRYAVVDYWRAREDAEHLFGVQVWINRQTTSRFVVPKSAIRAADQIVVRAGYDLTRFSRVIEYQGGRFYITYYPASTDVADGSYTVIVESKPIKAVPSIYHWNGLVDKVPR